MTTELWYLFWTTVLLGILWVPNIVGQVTNAGFLTPDDYRKLRNLDDFPDWVRRANRAHVNLVEQYGVFLGLVVIAHLAGISNGATAFACGLFFWARIAHAAVFIAGFSRFMARTVIFTVAWVALVILALQILFNAGAAA